MHPRNPYLDMIELKDAYRSGEDNHLGNTGQVRMEINTVMSHVRTHRSSMPQPVMFQPGERWASTTVNAGAHQERLPCSSPSQEELQWKTEERV